MSAIKREIEESMFRHLSEHFDPAIKKKIPATALRELLSCLADWAYVERNKWLVGLSESVKARATGTSVGQSLRERLKPDGERTTFLDALDEIR
jgi:hypothetical protein